MTFFMIIFHKKFFQYSFMWIIVLCIPFVFFIAIFSWKSHRYPRRWKTLVSYFIENVTAEISYVILHWTKFILQGGNRGEQKLIWKEGKMNLDWVNNMSSKRVFQFFRSNVFEQKIDYLYYNNRSKINVSSVQNMYHSNKTSSQFYLLRSLESVTYYFTVNYNRLTLLFVDISCV